MEYPIIENEIHHMFSPSRLQRVKMCPGSVWLENLVPEPEKSPEASEGTMLHKAVETGSLDGLTAEQEAAVGFCLDFKKSLMRDGDEVHHELKVDILDGTGRVMTYGTIDMLILHEDGTADMADWKFGRNIVPDPGVNYQMAAYALGAMQRFRLASVTAHIVQPRLYRARSHAFTNPVNIVKNLEYIINRANGPELILRCSEECRYCRAKSICNVFRLTFESAEMTPRVTVPSKTDLLEEPEMLLDYWERAQVVEKFINELKDAMTAYVTEHGRLGNWVMKERSGKREISNSVELCQRIQGLITAAEWRQCNTVNLTRVLDLLMEKTLARAAVDGVKMTKKAARENAESLIEDLIIKSRGTAVLTREDPK